MRALCDGCGVGFEVGFRSSTQPTLMRKFAPMGQAPPYEESQASTAPPLLFQFGSLAVAVVRCESASLSSSVSRWNFICLEAKMAELPGLCNHIRRVAHLLVSRTARVQWPSAPWPGDVPPALVYGQVGEKPWGRLSGADYLALSASFQLASAPRFHTWVPALSLKTRNPNR